MTRARARIRQTIRRMAANAALRLCDVVLMTTCRLAGHRWDWPQWRPRESVLTGYVCSRCGKANRFPGDAA